MLKGKCVVLGITGGIAAYKATDIVSRLTKMHCDVYCIMTKNATEFITPLTLETLTNHPVVTDTFARPETWEVEHISLAKRADLFLVAPATANFIGKMANGIADDMLTTTVMATKAPVLIAPAMNTNMYLNPIHQKNMETLRDLGVQFVEPGVGRLAEGSSGIGRLNETSLIVERAVSILLPKRDLEGKTVLVTAGPTQEKLDPVRYITNYSSGKMGFALARQAQKRGAHVILVKGPVTLPPPDGVECIDIVSTQDLYNAMDANCGRADIIIQAAAPADYRPKEIKAQKIKKDGDDPFILELVQNPDVAAHVGKLKKDGQVIVAFAAETNDLLEHAQEKRLRKNADLIVANDVTKPGAGFHTDTNIASIIGEDGVTDYPMMPKEELADVILDRAGALLK
ncbi:MAG: bifunctional phosphopantothenoylcysteine decarboxylase/phosphopantothenate--cysteine ligase CoaBC [Clostridia bacterium]|nr:bifunctional phosphopantothenoylcysteine decarboxylase/phosphopantothenate--cysteine ligase CoaBC [Clostridia bacterium]